MLEQLYEKLYIEILRWCTKLCGDSHTAEEVVHEAFLRAMSNEETLLNLNFRKQRAWMYRTTRNLFLDRLKKMKREYLYSFSADNGEETIPDDAIGKDFQNGLEEEMDEGSIIMEMILSRLPEQERTFFVMRYLMGYSSKELGELFGLPAGTVRSKLHSARKMLRDELKK